MKSVLRDLADDMTVLTIGSLDLPMGDMHIHLSEFRNVHKICQNDVSRSIFP